MLLYFGSSSCKSMFLRFFCNDVVTFGFQRTEEASAQPVSRQNMSNDRGCSVGKVSGFIHYLVANFPLNSPGWPGELSAGGESVLWGSSLSAVWLVPNLAHHLNVCIFLSDSHAHTYTITLFFKSKITQQTEMSDVFSFHGSAIKICKWYDKMHFTVMVTMSVMLNAFSIRMLLSDKAHQKFAQHGARVLVCEFWALSSVHKDTSSDS